MTYYNNYLQSKHWKDFRKEILSVRKRCQSCGKMSKSLNLHHINYKNIGKETNDDIIVLCTECHHRYHDKKKWKIAMGKKKDLTFTHASEKSKRKPYFNMNEVLRTCRRCGNQHGLFYKWFKTGNKVLAMVCPYSQPRTEFLKFEEIEGLQELSIENKR